MRIPTSAIDVNALMVCSVVPTDTRTFPCSSHGGAVSRAINTAALLCTSIGPSSTSCTNDMGNQRLIATLKEKDMHFILVWLLTIDTAQGTKNNIIDLPYCFSEIRAKTYNSCNKITAEFLLSPSVLFKAYSL